MSRSNDGRLALHSHCGGVKRDDEQAARVRVRWAERMWSAAAAGERGEAVAVTAATELYVAGWLL